MQLPLEIIKERLKKPENITFFKCASPFALYEKPVFYTGFGRLQSDTLYIAEADRIQQDIKTENGCAIICTGILTKKIRDKVSNVILLKEEEDLFDLANEILDIFELFDRWENSLLSASSSGQLRGMYQKMLDASSGIFENGLSIMDNGFRIVFQDETNITKSGYFHPVTESDSFSIPAETLSYFKYDKDYQRISEERGIFYYEGEMLPHRVLCKNIFRDEQFLFRIIITECIRPFRRTDEWLLEILAGHYAKTLYQFSIQSGLLATGIASLLTDAIENGTINKPAIDSELGKLSWSYNDTYRIASIHVSTDDLVISTLNYYAFEAAKLFPKSCTFPFHDTILVVINETRIGSIEQYAEALSVFVRENNFRIGISNFSDDIYKIQTMYRQAEMALTIGLSEKPMEWIHWFSRYTLQYIYNMLTNASELGQLYSPIYYRLERYDKENGTSYLETLRIYLKCRMNTVQAAKELFIQRSTMIYRLKRIREIADNDLEDQNDLLHLYLTFSIIERERQ